MTTFAQTKKTYFLWFHIQYFRNTTLHNKEMRIVDIQANTSKKVENLKNYIHPSRV